MLLRCFLLLLAFQSLSAQNPDSLMAIWKDKSLDDTTRLKALDHLSSEVFLEPKADSANQLAKIQYDYARDKGLKLYMANALFTQGKYWQNKNTQQKAIDYFKQSLSLRKQKDDTSGIANCHYQIAFSLSNISQYAASNDYYEKSMALYKALGNKEDVADCLNNTGLNYKRQGIYPKAIKRLTQSLKQHEKLNNKKGISASYQNIGLVHKDQGNYSKALNNFRSALKLEKELENEYQIAGNLLNIGLIHENRGQYDKALTYYKKCLDQVQQSGFEGRILSIILYNIGGIFKYQADSAIDKRKTGLANELYDTAMDNLERSLAIAQKIKAKAMVSADLSKIGHIYKEKGQFQKALDHAARGLSIAEKINSVGDKEYAAKVMYQINEELGRYKEALDMYEYLVEIRDSMKSKKNQRAILKQEYKYEYEKKALKDSLEFAKKQEVKNLKIEKQQANLSRQRIALVSAFGGLLLILGLAYTIYRGKRRSDNLLLNILPSETAEELKQKGYVDARQFDEVTVLFTDFKDFTKLTENTAPNDLVSKIDECFRAFDQIMEKYGIEKIKTIGDSYMAAGGLPVPGQVKPEHVVRAALEMQNFMTRYNQEKGDEGFEMRIGVHTGPVVAGIVGIKKFQYDIWGDTVNLASRMESSGELGKVNISESTYQRVSHQFNCEYRGKIEAKNKGEVDMYFVESAKD